MGELFGSQHLIRRVHISFAKNKDSECFRNNKDKLSLSFILNLHGSKHEKYYYSHTISRATRMQMHVTPEHTTALSLCI